MRIIYIIAGSGRMECDTCLRDGLLARTFKAKGHEVLFVPMYTPLHASVDDPRRHRLFFGGVNVFLRHKFPIFRRMPRFIERLFDHPRLLDFVARFGHMTQARDLAAMTVSMLEGEDGTQRKELDSLLEWLETQPRPDAVILPTSLLAGLAAPIRRRLGAPVLCLLSGEDQFIDQFPEPYRSETLGVLRRRARELDGCLAASNYYNAFMTDYLALAPGAVRTMTAGIDTRAYLEGGDSPRPELFTIGYRSQVWTPNGLHVLAEALRILKSNPETAACRVRAAGHLSPGDRPYLQEISEKIKRWGLAESFEYVGELSPEARIGFLKQLHVFTVPTVYPEPTGLFVPEALAAGTPVVLPRTGCLPEWIQRTGGGLLIEAAEPGPLAAALGRLMTDRELARRLGEAGHAAVHREFTLEKMADSTLDVLAACRQGAAGGG